MKSNYKPEAIVVGVSNGGLEALAIILPKLPENYPLPVIVVQHLREDSDSFLAQYLDNLCIIKVKEAQDKETINPACVYIAPPGYHLLIEEQGYFSLSMEEKVNYSRPSIDVLFESAAEVYEDALIGIVLTGANSDGAQGLKKIEQLGGMSIVQAPEQALSATMPLAAIGICRVDYVLKLEQIASFLSDLTARLNIE